MFHHNVKTAHCQCNRMCIVRSQLQYCQGGCLRQVVSHSRFITVTFIEVLRLADCFICE